MATSLKSPANVSVLSVNRGDKLSGSLQSLNPGLLVRRSKWNKPKQFYWVTLTLEVECFSELDSNQLCSHRAAQKKKKMNEDLCTQAYSHGFLKSYQCVGDFNKCCVHWGMLPWHNHTCVFMETSIQASGASSPPAFAFHFSPTHCLCYRTCRL